MAMIATDTSDHEDHDPLLSSSSSSSRSHPHSTIIPTIIDSFPSSSSASLTADEDILDIVTFSSLFSSSVARSVVRKNIKEILILAFPVSLSYLLQYSLSVITFVFLGHKNHDYLGAAALGSMYVNVTGLSIIFGLASAVDTLCSQAFGSGRKQLVGLIALRALILLTLLTTPIFFIWYYCESVLLFLGQDPHISHLAGTFARINTIGLIPLVWYEVLRKFFQSQRIMYPLMFIGILTNIVHAIACYVILYQWNMGFEGAAYAVVFSDCFTLLCGVIILRYLNLASTTCPSPLPYHSLFCGWKQMVVLGIPGMLMLCLEWWCFEICSLLAGLIGKIELDAIVVVLSLIAYCFMLPLGISTSTSTLTGNLLGAGKPKQARVVAISALILGACLVSVLCLFIVILRDHVAQIFTDDQAVAEAVATLTPLAAVEILFDGMQSICSGALRGAGKQELGAITNAIGYYAIGIPLSAFLSFGPYKEIFRDRGILLGLISGVVFTAVVLLSCLAAIDWIKEAVVAKERIEQENQSLSNINASLLVDAGGDEFNPSKDKQIELSVITIKQTLDDSPSIIDDRSSNDGVWMKSKKGGVNKKWGDDELRYRTIDEDEQQGDNRENGQGNKSARRNDGNDSNRNRKKTEGSEGGVDKKTEENDRRKE